MVDDGAPSNAGRRRMYVLVDLFVQGSEISFPNPTRPRHTAWHALGRQPQSWVYRRTNKSTCPAKALDQGKSRR